jgi:hypothetical protein
MDRKLLIKIHMYLAAFFAPAVLLVSISGGLYLLGIKGEVEHTIIYQSADSNIDTQSDTLKADVEALLGASGVDDYEFEYVKVKGSALITRPSSTEHFLVKITASGVEVVRAVPNLQSRMIELHKGHGPTAFKTFQKVFAVGLVFTMLSGVWLGVSAARLRRSMLLVTLAGTLIFVLLLL